MTIYTMSMKLQKETYGLKFQRNRCCLIVIKKENRDGRQATLHNPSVCSPSLTLRSLNMVYAVRTFGAHQNCSAPQLRIHWERYAKWLTRYGDEKNDLDSILLQFSSRCARRMSLIFK